MRALWLLCLPACAALKGASWVSVVLPAGAASTTFERAWVRTPPVSIDALFGTRRFAISLAEHPLWFEYALNADVLAHAHDEVALRRAVTVVLVSDYGPVRVSPDVAAALRRLDAKGLEARVRASALQLAAARVGAEPRAPRVLTDEAMKQALARLGVSA